MRCSFTHRLQELRTRCILSDFSFEYHRVELDNLKFYFFQFRVFNPFSVIKKEVTKEILSVWQVLPVLNSQSHGRIRDLGSSLDLFCPNRITSVYSYCIQTSV